MDTEAAAGILFPSRGFHDRGQCRDQRGVDQHERLVDVFEVQLTVAHLFTLTSIVTQLFQERCELVDVLEPRDMRQLLWSCACSANAPLLGCLNRLCSAVKLHGRVRGASSVPNRIGPSPRSCESRKQSPEWRSQEPHTGSDGLLAEYSLICNLINAELSLRQQGREAFLIAWRACPFS